MSFTRQLKSVLKRLFKMYSTVANFKGFGTQTLTTVCWERLKKL